MCEIEYIVGIITPSPQMHFLGILIIGLIFVIKINKVCLLLLEGRIHQIKLEGERNKREDIFFVVLAVLVKIFEEEFFV